MNLGPFESKKRAATLALLALIPAVHLYLQYFGNLETPALERLPSFSWLFISGLVTIRSLLAALRAQTQAIRVGWFCLALATAMWMTGIAYEAIAHVTVEGFSYGGTTARLLYLAYPVFLVAGLIALTWRGQRSSGTIQMANLGVIACAMLIYVLQILLEPVIQTDETLGYVIFSIADMTLMFTAIMMTLNFLWSAESTNLRLIVFLLGLSASIHVSVNIVFYYRVFNTGSSGHNLDVIWVLALIIQYWAAFEQDRASSGKVIASPKMSWVARYADAAQVALPAVLLLGMLTLMMVFSGRLTRTFATLALAPAILFAVFLGVRELAIDRHRKSLLSDLEEVHSLNTHVLRASPGVIFICEAGPGYRILYISENSRDFFGTDITNYDFYKKIHPDDQGILRAALKKTLAQGSASSEFRVLKDNDVWRWVNQRLILKHDAHNHPVEIVGTLVDITERKLLQSSLEQNQRLESLGRLSGSIAHDFNNLLTSVLGFSGLLLDGNKLGPQERESVREIQIAGERGAALTRQLLSFSRRHAFTKEVVELNALVESMRGMLERLLGDSVELHFHLSPLPVRLEGSKSQIEQVVMNLVINGSQAMPEGGRLSIIVSEVVANNLADMSTLNTTGRMAVLTVRDEGIGMNDELRKQIFDPFFTTKAEGTGLGLATVHGVVLQHGGYIDVQSSHGNGTNINIYLPTTSRDVDTSASNEMSVKPLGGTECILVVDDEVAITRVIASSLEPLGYKIVTANNADEALAVARKQPFDLLLSDIVMPGCNGQELNLKLRKIRSDFAVVYMSGYTNDTLMLSELESDNAPLLQKPLIIGQLAVVLRHQLDREPVDVAKSDRH